MTHIEKVRLLKLLYQYRAMGYEYFEEYRPLVLNENAPLAHTLDELKKGVLQCHLCALSKSRKNILFGNG